jgi:GntR family transcriptional regulator
MAASERKRLPLWHRIDLVLRNKIAIGEYQPGQALPSEPTLAAEFGVSRMTIREALRTLTQDGLVRQVQGKGTFVLPQPEVQASPRMVSSYVWNLERKAVFPVLSPDPLSKVPRCRSITLTTIEPPADVRRALAIEDQQIVQIERVVMNDEAVPAGFVIDYLPVDVGGRITRRDLAAAWMPKIVTEKLEIELSEAHQRVTATLADVRLSELLEIPFGAPLLFTERIYFHGKKSRPLYMARIWHRPDRFAYSATYHFRPALR